MNKITRYPFTPILGWSISRYDKFTTCKRRYYYDYYGKYDPEISRDRIDTFKQMTTIPLETGNIVHDVIRDLLFRLIKSNTPLNKKLFFEYADNMAKKYCQNKTFAEVYYKQIEQLPLEDIIAKGRRLLDNFITSDRYKWLTEEAISTKDDWIIEPDGYGETRIDEMKAYCKVDFLLPARDNLYILDWKTGKDDHEKHTKQLIGYSLWAISQFGYSHDKIKPIIVYLSPAYNEISIDVSEDDIKTFANSVKSETDEMYSFCNNIKENIPIHKEDFPMTPHLKVCPYCNYRELCTRK